MKIKITQSGFEGYTGPLGMSNFTDGVSDDHLSDQERLRLGSIFEIVEIDATGEEGEQVSPEVDYRDVYNVGAPVVTPVPTEAELKAAADKKSAADLAAPAIPVAPAIVVDPATPFTREALEVIADDKGIKGLREIGDQLAVKSNSIPLLIDAIILAQSKNPEIPSIDGPK